MTDRQIPPDQCGRTIVHDRHDTDKGWCPGLYASDVRPPDTTAARNAAAQMPLDRAVAATADDIRRHLAGDHTNCQHGWCFATPASPRPLVCPECSNGKHINCEPAWDPAADTTAPCSCTHGSPA